MNSPSKLPAFRTRAQALGRFLSGMVMPNIGAFIAWGFIAACFIPTGWIPNPSLAKLVGPMITYLLPLLIGYTGGQMVNGMRGGVIGTVTTMGVIVGADMPMFLGAMMVGPASAWLLKRCDKIVAGHIPTGFEMLANNFTLGIVGGLCAILAFLGIGPLATAVGEGFARGAQVIIQHQLLPLAHLLIEPGKVLFLNNAINHGILGPIAIGESHAAGKSILFMLEANPGPGLGLLLACWWLGRGSVKQSAPGAVVVHFLGGIHEIYFPYILMAPRLLAAPIAGGMCGTLTFSLFNAGLVAAPSPGSIFSFLAMTPKGSYLATVSGIVVAAAVSFAVAALLLKFGPANTEAEQTLEQAQAKASELKAKPIFNLHGAKQAAPVVAAQPAKTVRLIIFACDAGMGSSAMGAAILRKKFAAAKLNITVTNTAVENIPEDADIVITHKDITPRAQAQLPTAEHLSVQNLLGSPVYDELVQRFSSKA